MSDIVERLRKLAEKQKDDRGDYFFLGSADPEIEEAADHIAALEARNARLEEQVREAYERAAEAAEGEKYTQAYSDASYSAGDQKPQIYNDACDDIAQAIRSLKGAAK